MNRPTPTSGASRLLKHPAIQYTTNDVRVLSAVSLVDVRHRPKPSGRSKLLEYCPATIIKQQRNDLKVIPYTVRSAGPAATSVAGLASRGAGHTEEAGGSGLQEQRACPAKVCRRGGYLCALQPRDGRWGSGGPVLS